MTWLGSGSNAGSHWKEEKKKHFLLLLNTLVSDTLLISSLRCYTLHPLPMLELLCS